MAASWSLTSYFWQFKEFWRSLQVVLKSYSVFWKSIDCVVNVFVFDGSEVGIILVWRFCLFRWEPTVILRQIRRVLLSFVMILLPNCSKCV